MKDVSRVGLGRFWGARAGNFGITASILAVPLVMAAGLAVDLSTIMRTKAELQQAMDAAVLAVAREGKDISDGEARAIARTFVSGNLDPDFTDLEVARDGTAVTLNAGTPAGMAFGALFGFRNWPVEAASSADIAYTSYEIGLVLDTTGSMKGGKLAAMKDAVLGLIDDLSDQVDNEDKLKFAMVPFATFVNVGPQFGPEFNERDEVIAGTGAPWLDVHGDSRIEQLELREGVSRFEVFRRLGKDWKGCVETRDPSDGGEHDVADTPAVPGDAASYFVPAFAIDEPDTGGYDNSYIESDVDPLDDSLEAQVEKLLKYGLGDLLDALGLGGALDLLGLGGLLGGGGGDVDTDYSNGKGPDRGCDTQPITALNSVYGDMKDKVGELVATGTTNIMEGVAWGHRVLSPGEPFGQGGDDEPGLEKIMIVLTDGANNFGTRSNALGSSYSSFGYLVDGRLGITAGGAAATNDLMNDKTLAACDSAKEEGNVEIYTIRLEEPDAATGTLLLDCASTPAHFFDAPSRNDLREVFGTIGENIVRLRISS